MSLQIKVKWETLSIRCLFLFTFFYLSIINTFSQKLVSQPFIGHTTTNELNAWCLFKKADTVFIRISNAQKDAVDEKIFLYSKAACFRDFLPVNCHFDGLNENTTYHLQYSFDHKNFLPLLSCKTNRDSITDFSFLAGSCAFIGTGFNGILKPFANLSIFNSMKNDSSNFMLWLGDNLYYVFEYHSYKHQLKRNIKTRLNKKLSAFLNSRQQYAIWDDHDYGGNNSDGSYKYKTSSLNVFQQFWCNPRNDGKNYYTFHQQDCQFFMLDDRYNNENENIGL